MDLLRYALSEDAETVFKIIPIVISVISLCISAFAGYMAKTGSNYLTIDSQYKDLLNQSINRPILRDPIFTSNYLQHKDDDPDNYYAYNSYAYMVWNYLETVYDLAIKRKSKYLRKVWTPVLIEENKIHYKWFRHNRFLFREQFQKYVDEQLNALVLDEGNLSDFEHLYPYFEKEFPESERKSKSQIIHLLVKGVYNLVLLRFKNREEKDNSFLGYAIYHNDKDNSMMFLDYLHILDEYQSCGYGSKFIHLLDEKLVRPLNKGIFFEIEPMADDKTSRRNAFYLRNGARKLNVKYLLPTTKGSMNMDLMVIPSINVNYISKDEIKVFIKESVGLIHSDYTHTNEVIDKYINDIPSFSIKDDEDIVLEKGDKDMLNIFFSKMKNSFSKDLTLDVEHLSKLIDGGQYKLYVIYSNINGVRDVIGFTCVYEPKDKNFAFIDYLYTSEIVQGKGYGKKIVDQLEYIYRDYKYGLLCEVPVPKENQVDYYTKFVIKTAGQFLNCKYKYPGNEKQTPLRLAIYPKENVDYISKDILVESLNDALKYIHFDSKTLDKTLEYNSKNMKDFYNDLYKKKEPLN